MAGAAFSLTAEVDLSPWQAMVKRLRSFSAERFDAAMDELGEAYVSSTTKRFHAQHDPMGNPWKQSERAKREGGETLIDKRLLLYSLTHNVLHGQGVEWGSNKVYARVHQEGFDRIVQPHPQAIYRRYEDGKGASGAAWSAFANGGRFAKKSKANIVTWTTIAQAFTIHLPARPYLGLDAADISTGIDVLTRHLAAAVLDRDVRSIQ